MPSMPRPSMAIDEGSGTRETVVPEEKLNALPAPSVIFKNSVTEYVLVKWVIVSPLYYYRRESCFSRKLFHAAPVSFSTVAFLAA